MACHLHIRIQALGDRFGNDGALVLLQGVDLDLDVGGEGVNLGAHRIKVSYDIILQIHTREEYPFS